MTTHRTLFWLLLVLTLALSLIALVACDPLFTPAFTPTPTRTPRPTATPTPTLTPTPSPTPTPAWPVTVACGPYVPAEACARLRAAVEADPAHFRWADEPDTAQVRLDSEALPNARPVGVWTYALAAPFFTLDDEAALSDLRTTWTGAPTGPFALHPLLVTTDTLNVLIGQWGPPTGETIRVVEPGALLTEALNLDGWVLLPFHELEPRWKVLRVDGRSPLEKGLTDYGLSVPLYLGAQRRTDAFPLLPADFSNRDESRMAVVAMTGVTALTRGTARTMEQKGVTYPARDIGPWLQEADLTHISNEVSFTPDCPVPPRLGTMTFCSHERYIELLDAVGTDVVELTGNHNNDYGTGPHLHTLDLFRQRGWRWFGGGANLAEAMTPITVTLGPNRLAFIGCNSVGPSYAYATEDSPGAAPCGDWTWIREKIAGLRAKGYLPIVTVQYYETYEYFPTPQQVADFRALADAGAVVVQGSQAHQPQGFDFHAGAFIHYGLGNLFFDQMQSLATRQEFIDRLVFYDGRLLGVDLRTALLEEGARPRPMAPPERRALLEAVFAASPGRK
ncbi:MAG: CapA family protein [Anaerolineae bacterium]|nr:CapA family protein [Anaerolineae bacterium]MDW8069320.1 CapA family protein [Anaerolineae bacterium]